MEIVDLVACAPMEYVDSLFQNFINIFAETTNLSASRIAALDGALRYVIRKPNLRFEFVSNLLKTSKEDDRDLIRSAAKIIGTVYANWPAAELLDKLVELAEHVEVQDQVAFEIGACKIQLALSTADPLVVQRELHDSKYWFEQSLSADTDRHDSAIYLTSVACLLDFHRGNSIDTQVVSNNIKKQAAFLLSLIHI